ncbi:MAG: ribonuclease H-like domain-containing protein [Anaerolineae bacterium]
MASCALQSLERHILDLEREDDVPGWLVPERYFRYQSDGDARLLVGVFHHNAPTS